MTKKIFACVDEKGDIQVTLDKEGWYNCTDPLILQRLSQEIHRLSNYIINNKKWYSHYKRPDKYRKSETFKKLELLLSIYYGAKVELKI